jgi:hypothetical protein
VQALADLDQAAHDVADHVVQEGVGLEIEAPVGAALLDDDGGELLDGRQGLAQAGAKGGEVVFTLQVRGGSAHGRAVERAKAQPTRVASRLGRTGDCRTM